MKGTSYMATIGNSLAFGLLLLICIVFFRTKHYLTKASRYYRVCLILALATAAFNTMRLETVRLGSAPSWLVMSFSTLEFFIVFILTSTMTLYLVAKVIENNIRKHAMRFAYVYLTVISLLFSAGVIENLFGGLLFSVGEDGSFIEGPLYYLPYFIIVPQLILVTIYCVRFRKLLNRSVLFAMIESLMAIGFSLIIKWMYEVSVLVLALALIQLIFFLDFQRQKMDVNSVTKLNDGRVFFLDVEKRIKKNPNFKAYLIWIENIGTIKANYGNKIGDMVQYRFAYFLEHLFLNSVAFHMYGANFTLIVDNDNSTDYTKELLAFLDNGIMLDNMNFPLTYTVSEKAWDEDERSPEAFYEKLEYGVSMAKDSGRKFLQYTLDLEAARLRQKYLISRMKSVSESDGYELWFQPIFSNRKNSYSSMEALLRLKESDGTYISPAEFIPLAEKTGQITNITWFVIEQTCRALSENRELDGIRVSVNLPMLHLVDPQFESKLNEIVDSFGIPHERISFEFTERVILEDLSLAEQNMRSLAKSGYTFYLDDFGVGYSNFNCVLRLPLKTIKLDMSITSTTEKLEENQNLVCILTDLFHDMGLNVVAEGAETAEQVEMLRSFGVDGIQGYYFAKPMPLSKLREFLSKSPYSERKSVKAN